MGTLTEQERLAMKGFAIDSIGGDAVSRDRQDRLAKYVIALCGEAESLQAPAEPKPDEPYTLTAEELADMDRYRLDEPTAPSDGEAQTEVGDIGFPTSGTQSTQAQQAQVADRARIKEILSGHWLANKVTGYHAGMPDDVLEDRLDKIMSLFTPPSPKASREGT